MKMRVTLVVAIVAVTAIAVFTVTAFSSEEARIMRTVPDTGAAQSRPRSENATASWDSELSFHQCCDDSLNEVSFARGGGTAFRSLLRYGDAPVTNGTRAEVHTGGWEASHFSSGDHVYYGFSIYIVGNWETDSQEEILFQWHTTPDECEDMKYPSAFLSVQPEGIWRLRVNSDDSPCTTPDSMTRSGFDLAEVQPGSWHDFVFEFIWDHTDEGAVNVWHQTDKDLGWEPVLTTTGANTFNDTPSSHGYLKWGIYKPAWNTGPTHVDERVVFHDNVSFGDSFDSVDPSAER